jgi:hypothetical protein
MQKRARSASGPSSASAASSRCLGTEWLCLTLIVVLLCPTDFRTRITSILHSINQEQPLRRSVRVESAARLPMGRITGIVVMVI